MRQASQSAPEIAESSRGDDADFSTQRMNEVLDCLPQGVVMFSADARILFVNRRFCEIYGMPPDKVRPGLSLVELMALRAGTPTLEKRRERYAARLLETVGKNQQVSNFFQTVEGKTIHAINTPLPSGGWIVTHEDVTEQHKVEMRIDHMASHDVLTGLLNRTAFRDRLDKLRRTVPSGRMLAVMLLDLDHFTGINNTLGHRIGDELLKSVARRLRSSLGEGDVIARSGGDEFVVASASAGSPAQAAATAMSLRDAILLPHEVFGHRLVVDASIGIALCPADGADADALLKNADLALYSAKTRGRGTFCFFEHEMDVRMRERCSLELDLRAALPRGEFEVHYQPVIDLRNNRVSSCEALLRWKHPTRGMVPPASFITLAEEIGLITRLGEWVIRTACAAAVRWPREVGVAVNVSPVQFQSRTLMQTVVGALAATGLAPHRLGIEITEALLLDDTDEMLAMLRQLHQLGVKIVMDDFGTGYSSLGYLRKFRFDKIKIDRAFVSGLTGSEESGAIVRAVTRIADSFHMTTIAEGVETEEQRAIVAALGCTEMQGNLFSPALPADRIARLLGLPGRKRRTA